MSDFCKTCRTRGGKHKCWHCNKVFEVLEELIAADVLSVPCGEAPAERVFSIAGRVFRGRDLLTPERLAQLVFLRKNRT